MKQEPNSLINESEKEKELYWRTMYEELELQMYNMMQMTLELIENESASESSTRKNKMAEANLEVPKNFQQEFRRLKLFEHRIKVTWLGKLTLKYIGLKRKIKTLIKGK